MAKCRAEPEYFLRKILGCDPWLKQVEIANAVRDHRRVAVRSCHGSGKSWLAARVALWWLYCYPGSIVATTAPTFRQVKRILWQELRAAWSTAIVPLGGPKPNQTELQLGPKWFAFGFSSDNPDAAQGLHAEHLLLIVDEACGIPPEIAEALEGNLSSKHNHIFQIGNPTDSQTPFGAEFKSADTCKIKISAFDTPDFTEGKTIPGLVTRQWVEEKKRKWGETSPMYIARVLGDFPPVERDRLIPLQWIERAMESDLKPVAEDTRLLSVDVARFGEDQTVIVDRHGPTARFVSVEQKRDTMETAGKVVSFMRAIPATVARIDSVGVGGGVYDRLKELGIPVEEFQAGGQAADSERFINRRAEGFWHLRELFERGEIAIEKDDDLANELSAIRYKLDSRGRIQIESKDDMKKRGMHSPDKSDALMMAFAGPGPEGKKVVPFYFA